MENSVAHAWAGTRSAALLAVIALLLTSSCSLDDSGRPDPSDPDITVTTDHGRHGATSVVEVPSTVAEQPRLPLVTYADGEREYVLDLVSAEYWATNRGDPQRLDVLAVDDGELRLSHRVTDPLRYIGVAELLGDWVAFVDAPATDQTASTGPSIVRVAHLAIDSRSRVVPPPAGYSWSHWPGTLVASSDAFFGVVRADDGSGDCVVWIDAAAATSTLLHCLDDRYIGFSVASPGGVSVLGFPVGQNLVDCRERWHITLDGEASLLGAGGECTVFDGLLVEGWQVVTPEVGTGYIASETTLVATSPDGDRYDLGAIKTGSLRSCGPDVWWYRDAPTDVPDDPDEVRSELLRWRPGADTSLIVDRASPAGATGGIACVDGLITSTESLTVEPFTTSVYTFAS